MLLLDLGPTYELVVVLLHNLIKKLKSKFDYKEEQEKGQKSAENEEKRLK